MSGDIGESLRTFAQQQKLEEADAICMPPVIPHQHFLPNPYVDHAGVNLRSVVSWHSNATDFFHETEVGEHWRFSYGGRVHIADYGNWDVRTPILHPAVAGVDVSEAGYDDAYLRAMQQVDVLTYGLRDENKMIMRKLVERYSKLRYSPYRLLVRGVVLWAITSRNEASGRPVRTLYDATGVAQPLRLSDTGGFGALARQQYETPSDVIYVRCEHVGELGQVDVARALAASSCPVDTNMSIKGFWPTMDNPQVVYASARSAGMGTSSIDAETVESFLYRFCTLFDCFDLLKLALQQVQMYLCRPLRAGIWAGASLVVVGMPRSDMRIGAIGPLLAGVSAEGMRTNRLLLPGWNEFAYGGAVRAGFVTAAYYESLLKFDQTHPVAYTYSSYIRTGRARLLCDLASSSSFNRVHVAATVKMAGWDCLPEQLTAFCPMHFSGFERNLFKGGSVPWWTNMLGHLAEGGHELLGDWLRPAHTMDVITPGAWYTYQTLEGATQSQVTSAVRWMGANVSYVVNSGITRIEQLSVAVPSPSRFMALLKPTIVINGHQKAVACMQFGSNVHKGRSFIRALGQCKFTVTKPLPGTTPLPAAGVGIDMISSPPNSLGGATRVQVLEPRDGTADEQAFLAGGGGDDAGSGGGGHSATDNIDWEEVVDQLRPLGVNTSSSVFGAALTQPYARGNASHLAATQLECVDLQAVERMGKSEARLAAARAILLATTRLALHVGGNSAKYSELQGGAMRIISETVASKVPAPAATTQAELDEQATAALAEASAAAGGHVQGHDDPEGTTETVEDFGQDQLPADSGQEPPTASSAEPPSHMETIGFQPPGDSGRLEITYLPPDPVVPPQ